MVAFPDRIKMVEFWIRVCHRTQPKGILYYFFIMLYTDTFFVMCQNVGSKSLTSFFHVLFENS